MDARKNSVSPLKDGANHWTSNQIIMLQQEMRGARERRPSTSRRSYRRFSRRPVSASAGSLNSSIGGSIFASTILSIEDQSDEEDSMQLLNDQQWVLQRKKIGLSRKTSRSLAKVSSNNAKKSSTIQFLKSFRRKECLRFVKDPSKKFRPRGAGPGPKRCDMCYCGAPEDEHKSRATHMLEQRRTLQENEAIMEEDEENSSRASSSRPIITVDSPKTSEFKEFKRMPPYLLSQHDQYEQQSVRRESTDFGSDLENLFSSLNNTKSSLKLAVSTLDEAKHDVIEKGAKKIQNEEKIPFQLESKKGNLFQAGWKYSNFIVNTADSMMTPETDDWNDSTAISEFPTNAFGDIEFINEDEGSSKPAKYIRLADSTPMPKVKRLLEDCWNLFHPKRPHLAISLIGGAKNFRMEGRKKETFKTGLIAAAKSTHALILTGGSNTGTMKLVGDAVRDGQFMVAVSSYY